MDLWKHVDIYCERTGPEFWSEPLNAISNVAFILAALLVWAILGGQQDREARILTLNLGVIGIGSFLFHTYAQTWAEMADVLPIQAFILIYLYFAMIRIFSLPIWAGLVAVAAFFPYAYMSATLIGGYTGSLNGSIAYVPVLLLLGLMALATIPRDPGTAKGLAIGAGILLVSLFFRSIDASVCTTLPFGTHFIWHTLNAIMLGWVILVLHRHEVHAR